MVEFNFDVEKPSLDSLEQRRREWARRVFAEPVQLAGDDLLSIFAGEISDPAVETAMYTNLQSRDSEISAYLIGRNRTELRDSISLVRQTLIKRERDLGASRTRIEMMDRVNASEPNSKLHYPPQVYQEIISNMNVTWREYSYLQNRRHMLDALERLLGTFEVASSGKHTDEQMLRLFAQAYRGHMRLKGFETHFRDLLGRDIRLAPFTNDHGFEGYVLPLGERHPVVLDRVACSYLYHLLETIEILADSSASYLASHRNVEEGDWFPLFATLRAVVEFFYICNFELPYFHTELVITHDGEERVLTFDRERNEWQPVEEPSARQTRRICTEAAKLVVENTELLKCRSVDEVSRLLKRELATSTQLPPANDVTFRPYLGFGLADFDFNPATQRTKMQAAFPLVMSIVDHLASDAQRFPLLSSGVAGSPAQTLLGLAELDWKAYGLVSEPAALAGLEKHRLLSRFWRTVSRRRAISMLGDAYSRKVTMAMEALGEPGPEHPTFMSLVLKPTMTSIALTRGEELSNPFSELMIADQVRLAEMLGLTWAVAAEFLERLKDVHSQGKLKRIIESLPQMIQVQQNELKRRFNPKWLQSQHWVWSLLRAVAPTVWDFWRKAGEGVMWQEPLLVMPPLQALNLLIKLFCETARMLLLIEVSGTAIGERLETDAEGAAQSILSSIQGYLDGSSMPQVLAEAVNYYYDPEERLDSWLSFTSALRLHLRQMLIDYQKIDAGKQYIDGVSSILSQLEMLYPSTQKAIEAAQEAVPITPSVAVHTVPISEAGALCFGRVFFELLELQESDTVLFLKLLSMLAHSNTEQFINCPERVHILVSELLPEQYQRLLLFGFPGATQAFFDYLRNLEKDKPLTEQMAESIRSRSADYFRKLASYADTVIEITSQLPTILPEDYETLKNFFHASAPATREVSYLFLFACEQLFMDVCTTRADRGYQLETAPVKIRSYLRKQGGSNFEDPAIEFFPVGGGRILYQHGSITVTGQNDSFELSFSEPEKPMSNYLVSKVASIKSSFIARLLHEEFPGIQFSLLM